jgi:molecular chaperone DnaJ
VHLAVVPDPRFARQGDSINTTLTISVAQAALGTEADVETLEGTQRLTIAPGTQHGHVERLRGAGVPHLRGRGRGDLFVHLLVETPRDLTPEQDELLRQFAAARGEQVAPPGGTGGEGVFSRLRSAFG